MKILITGGAGFVGSRMALLWKKDHPQDEVFCFDNLRRRGSELNLADFKTRGIHFVHGDIRNPSDLEDLNQNFDVLIEASAEPSVHAGTEGSPKYVLDTNLTGAQNCFEFARKHCGFTIFISTSRVYSIAPLRNLPLKILGSRLTLETSEPQQGFGPQGISENFSVATARSFYGSTKLAAELLLQEYAETYKMAAVINRCGVICGEGQWGKTDQGVFTLWVARHFFGGKLSFTGFGGEGHQVRDLLHTEDLYRLFRAQISAPEKSLPIYNVGGGAKVSVSLKEYTEICQNITGQEIPIGRVTESAAVDIPYYVSDSRPVESKYNWSPKVNSEEIVRRIHHWLKGHEEVLRPFFGA